MAFIRENLKKISRFKAQAYYCSTIGMKLVQRLTFNLNSSVQFQNHSDFPRRVTFSKLESMIFS